MNQFKKLVCVVCFASASTLAVAQKSVKKYIKKYEALAMEKSAEHQIPVSIILGVSIEESAAGKSLIARKLNNFFGVKGKNTSSEKTMGYKSKYREYKTVRESFTHFCEILTRKKFYQKLKGSTDYTKWLASMNTADYATARDTWVAHITRTIKAYELDKLDKRMVESVALKTP